MFDFLLINDLLKNENYSEGIEYCKSYLVKDPQSSMAWYQLAYMLYYEKLYEESEKAFYKSIDLRPNDFYRKYAHLGFLLLMKGNLLDGFKFFEYRKHCVLYRNISKSLGTPLWNGEQIAGKKLMVYHDGGAGDSFQYLRYLRYIKDRFRCTPVLHLQEELHCLFKNCGIPLVDQDHPHDVHEFIWSLPYCFSTDISNIPPPLNLSWRLKPQKGKIGLVWRSGSFEDSRHLKSVGLDPLLPLLKLDKYRFVSLQKKVLDEDRDILKKYKVYVPYIDTFADTVKEIENCELVITTDTSVAHLAGSIGVPTWILLSYNACWRWLDSRSDSPWYPSVRLFRQSKRNIWKDPVEEIRQCLL